MEQEVLPTNEQPGNERKRAQLFEKAWQERWKKGHFQTKENESPFAKYSSRGWKIHIAFRKGKEKEVARFLYVKELYFKLDSEGETFFNPRKASGATIYIGSWDNMQEIAGIIEENLGELLEDGRTIKVGNRIVNVGSGSDIEVRPKITARFDVAKTKFGWLSGNKPYKYAEAGIFFLQDHFGGIPILEKYSGEVAKIIWGGYDLPPEQQTKYFEKNKENYMRLNAIYQESAWELIKDFGRKFVFGKTR